MVSPALTTAPPPGAGKVVSGTHQEAHVSGFDVYAYGMVSKSILYKLDGELPEGATATDLVLTVTPRHIRMPCHLGGPSSG